MGVIPESDIPLVIPTQGYTPNCWENRSVIFFANLLSLFFGNRGGAKLLEDEISCVDSYGGRLAPVLGLIFGGGENVLVLERKPDPALTDFFRSIGLRLPRLEILPRNAFLSLGELLSRGQAAGHPLLDRLMIERAEILDGFVTDETIALLAATLGKRTLSSLSGSHRGNNKLLLHEHLESTGLPVFPTHLANNTGEVAAALNKFRSEGRRHAVAKSQIGASGIGLVRLATDKTPERLPDAFFHEGPCMVQAWLEPGSDGIREVLSPSVQLFLNEDSAYLYDVTEQILSAHESVHEGNESPPTYLDDFTGLLRELFRQAGEAARWLHRQGYRGAASVDFLLTMLDDGSFVAYVCEINARVTGATYPSVIARHFRPRGAWRMRNLRLTTPLPGALLLEKLQAHTELFSKDTGRGILPVNFNLEPDGLVRKGQFLAIAEDVPSCRELLEIARHDLPVAWDYTRDR